MAIGTVKVSVASSLIGAVTLQNPIANGEGSLSYGAETKALTSGSAAMGIMSIAGCKGFCWKKIELVANGYKIYLSDSRSSLGSILSSWTKNSQTLLSNWEKGEMISIVNDIRYPRSCKIIEIDVNNGIITVESVPFEVYSTITAGSSTYDDYTVSNPQKPEAGVFDLAYGAATIGLQSKSTGTFSLATGFNTIAAGDYGHTEGKDTIAGYCGHAEGDSTKANAAYSHAEGRGTVAKSIGGHVQGTYNLLENAENYAHIIGNGEPGIRSNAHTVDWNGNAWYAGDIKVKNDTNPLSSVGQKGANGKGSEVFNKYADTSATSVKNEATADYASAFGNATKANGKCGMATGYQTMIAENGSYASTEGYKTTAIATTSHIEGYSSLNAKDVELEYGIDLNDTKITITDIETAWKKGLTNASKGFSVAAGRYSHVEGQNGMSAGDNSHVEGRLCRALGGYSHVEGNMSIASGTGAHAEGYETHAEGNNSHTEGIGTYAKGMNQHVEGRWNLIDTKATTSGTEGEYAHIIGNGSSSKRSNAYTLDWKGNPWYAGNTITFAQGAVNLTYENGRLYINISEE